MKNSSSPDRYLKKRGGVYWYRRRVPRHFCHLDPRGRIEETLNTDSLETARLRRDLKVVEDEKYWHALEMATLADDGAIDHVRSAVVQRYEAAKAKALAAGFTYIPADRLAEEESIEEIVTRLLAVRARSGGDEVVVKPRKAEAVVGGAPEPIVRVSDVFDLYIGEIGVPDLLYKSEHQRYSWKKVKRTSVSYFIDQMGDLPIRDITREQALTYHRWWLKQMEPNKRSKKKPVSANTVNRHIGNMRTMYERYFQHIGEEERPNPFRKLYIKQKTEKEVPAFSTDWVRSKILAPGALSGMRPELQLIVYMLIETGCRPSEIINLQPEDIRIDAEVPHIAIKARAHGEKRREVKTDTSEREIPLVGVSLEAARRAPKAFPHYFDRNELVSANLLKSLRNRKLFETDEHVVYSLRHAFEKRMQEANIDYGLRCLLMGHKTKRPDYGDGGELAYRRGELNKIVHSYPDDVFRLFDSEHGQWWQSH